MAAPTSLTSPDLYNYGHFLCLYKGKIVYVFHGCWLQPVESRKRHINVRGDVNVLCVREGNSMADFRPLSAGFFFGI